MALPSTDRRGFLEKAAGLGAAFAWSGTAASQTPEELSKPATKRIRIGVIGCGSVSHSYLPNLAKNQFVELISTCDIVAERAANQANKFNIPNHYPNISKMLAGAPFDLLVNLTDMQEHEHLNQKAIAAGKHVWSEKPIANTLEAGQEILRQARVKGVRVWGAPVVVASPQFTFMAKQLAAGKLGRVACAHAQYGHTGPTWSAFFYEKGGGSLPDLGVYNLTTLTGLLGPATAVTAMVSIVTPTRRVDNEGEIQVTEEDNAMVVMDHGGGVLSHVQCGFNYFNPHGHGGGQETQSTIQLFGSEGNMGLVGYDWEPLGVDLSTVNQPVPERHATDAQSYVWPQGASDVAECLATGKEPLFTPEHALHVVDIICAARESHATGRRIELSSTFRWPIVS